MSVCQRASLVDVGATKVIRADFVSGAPSVSATQVVARFVDEVSAQRAYAVLDAWVSTCAQALREQGAKPLRVPDAFSAVAVTGAQAGTAVLFFDPGAGAAARIQPQLAVRKGETISWVVYRQSGQDYNYPAGESPPERAAPLVADAMP